MHKYRKWLIAIFIGLLAGIATIYFIPSQVEILLWIILTIVIGLLCHKFYPEKIFIKTFLFALLTGITITLTHITLLKDYLLSHKVEIEVLDKIRLFNSDRLTLVIIAPIYWLALGLLSGLTVEIIRRTIQKKE